MNTSKDIRTVLYQASKVISEGQTLIEVDRDEKQLFDIIEGTSIFVKIPILGKIPPCKVMIEYTYKGRNDLRVCISRRSKEPNMNNSERTLLKPHTVQMESGDPVFT